MAPTLQSDSRQATSRRVSKHLTERKRRARINDSLLQLKTIVYPAVKNEVVQNSKIEKADILDMTLRYVKDIQQKSREGKEPSIDQYHAGYSECLSQVSNFLTSCDSLGLEARRNMLTHLADKGLASYSQPRLAASPPPPVASSPAHMQLPQPERRAPSVPVTPQGFIYLLPAHAVQHIQTIAAAGQVQQQFSPPQTLVVSSPVVSSPVVSSPVVSSPVVNVLPTPPNSPVSAKQYPPSSHYQTVLRDATHAGAHVTAVGTPASSAEDASVWRPW